MKTTILRYGLYAGIAQVIFFAVSWIIDRLIGVNYDSQEVIGYAGILLCLSFVYFGIRYYRDHVNNGAITFLRGLKLGLLIMLIPAVCFGILDTLYVAIVDPHFYEHYSAKMLEDLRKSTPAAQLPAKLKEMKAQMEFYKSPYVGFTVMFLTVAAIGVIVSLISALLLRRNAGQNSYNTPSLQN